MRLLRWAILKRITISVAVLVALRDDAVIAGADGTGDVCIVGITLELISGCH